MKTVTFRLSDDLFAKLQQMAQQLGRTSPHKCARRIVVTYLQDAERTHVRQGMADLQKDIQSLREELATAVVVLLARAGKVNAEEAKEWVERNFGLS